MIRSVDWFNEHFKEVMGPLILNDQNIDYYQLFMAKKSGKPNDDFPSKAIFYIKPILGIEKSQIVSKVNFTRFALCFDPAAVHPNPLVA